MYECPTCGAIFSHSCRFRGTRNHVNKCKTASLKERKTFKTTGHWPKKNGGRRAAKGIQV